MLTKLILCQTAFEMPDESPLEPLANAFDQE